MHRPKIVIYTRGWSDDSPTEEGGEPTSQYSSRVFLDGQELPTVRAEVKTRADKFVTVELELYPGSVEVRPIDGVNFMDSDLAP